MSAAFTTRNCLLLAICTVVCGCSRTNRPATYPVRGTLTYQGKPVSGATIDFLAPGASRPAVAETDSNGRFSLTTFEADDGAIVGTHVVTVIKNSSQSVPIAEAPAENNPAAIEKAMAQAALQQRRARSLIPVKYTERKTSDLRVDIGPHDNQVELKLVD